MRSMLAAASCFAFSILTANGQGTTDTPEFEAASVKPADAKDISPFALMKLPIADRVGFEGGPGTKDPGRIRYHGVTLKMLLSRAYDVTPDLISGPAWPGSERYTIEATLPPGTDAGRLRSMLQKLLTERFQIILHREVKDTPVYRLKVAKNGPKLKPPEDPPQYQNEEERKEAVQKQARANLEKMTAERQAIGGGGAGLSGRSFSLPRATTGKFAETLSGHLDRPVKDATQLEGEYHFQLWWNPDNGRGDGASGVSIFTAIQEQLGLRLEAGSEALEILVIEKAEKTPIRN